jgi:hypothetical protein
MKTETKAPDKKGAWVDKQKQVLNQARTMCKGGKIKGKGKK